MKSSIRIATTVWIVVIGLAGVALSETVELKSSSLTVLTNAERERFLAAHNAARRQVDVDPVGWSDDLARHALESLKQQKEALIDAAKEGWKDGFAVLPKHQVETNYGENIAGWVGRRSSPAEFAVELWLREKPAFDKLNADSTYRVGDEADKSETDARGKERPIVVGHYTALVWKATSHIGAARLSFDLVDDQGTTRSYSAIICVYDPPGNRRGEKPYPAAKGR